MTVKFFLESELILTFNKVENRELNLLLFNLSTSIILTSFKKWDKKQFKNMINICIKHGVRIYSYVFINHKAGNGKFMYIDHKIIQEVVYNLVLK